MALIKEPFSGYYHREVPEHDRELTEVGPGTPCGEYLRRFWHPVGMTATLKDLPKRIRVMGEDLVLFATAVEKSDFSSCTQPPRHVAGIWHGRALRHSLLLSRLALRR